VTGVVYDQNEVRKAGVAVTGTWTYPDGSVQAVLMVSDRLGQWNASDVLAQCGLYQFDVTDLFLPGFTYSAAANETSPHTQIVIKCN